MEKSRLLSRKAALPGASMRAHYPTITQIIYAVVPVGSAIYGMAAHESYGMGLAMCGIIGGVLGLITRHC
jgi:hypothetical protein